MSTVATRPTAGITRRLGRKALLPLGLLGILVALSVLRVATGVNDIDSANAISAAVVAAVPLALAGLGGLWSERAGVVNIGLEGMMIMGSWSAAYAAYHWGAWAGVIAAIAGGMLFGVLHAIATVFFGVDQIVSGVAINLLGAGLTKFLAERFFSSLPGGGATQSPSLPDIGTFTVPGSSALSDLEGKHWFLVSDLAGILGGLLTNVSWLTLITVLLIAATAYVLWRTPFGLRLRSCGEAPQAAETLGVNVYLYKTIAVLVSGALAGLGGGFLAMVASDGFQQGQTGGRGYIGLAAMIFGNWMPLGTALGALLFGYTQALQLRGGDQVHALLLLVGAGVIVGAIWMAVRRRVLPAVILAVTAVLVLSWYFGSNTIDPNLTSTAPYVVTLLVMAFASQHLRMPAADGDVYRKGEAG
ncbi:ABC transporter permease [Dermacoccus nishinomiyaensis]|uniref:ABC transporter permease n=1 Tax=Dermacoccus nishinomiyaensis TaxID=1274 RepID=UPI000EBD3863|nr:ABC transporter permease [Dermacoccus nishinomiyaensis]MCG7430251.1 ABC transporter permease [Dermacoccus nishinomiyaensis]MCT1603348.1 ABC transporter permease [Dermacoccus nishinomiyaensis]NHC32167.1 ABC transporter permease [Dermacoccus nishinomiyaensis]HCQ19219.1 ABC transporter permease [Dermacoccus sp.]